MKLFLVGITLAWTVEALGQEDIKHKIVGNWCTYLSSGDSGIFHFYADGSMFIAPPKSKGFPTGKGKVTLDDGRTVNSLMRYVINTKSQPIQIDFYFSIDNYFNVVGKAEGIVELLDNNLIRLAMNFSRPRALRPENFDNPTETVVLSRTGEKIEINSCEQFRVGRFKIFDAFIGTTLIQRDKNFQIESNDLGDKVKLKIEWTSDCTYTLKPIEFYMNNNWLPDTTGVLQTIQIIKIKKNSYIFSTGNNKTDIRMTRELFVADD